MKKYLISPEKKQYKANLHCHSVLSDGCKTPEELKEMYKSHGYDILAITDHERPYDHQALSDPEFLMITGYECYIRPSGCYNKYDREIHLNLFARDPKNLKMINFDERYAAYLKRDKAIDSLVRVGSERPREYTKEYINEYIQTAKDNGYILSYNHPYWSMDDEADILGYEGFFSLEICNYGSYLTNNLDYCGALYDKMLCKGKRVFCHGADDNHNGYPETHPKCDSFGAFTMIMADEFSYNGVINAMEAGEMYASMGPSFKEVSVEDGNIHIECSDVKSIFVYMGSKTPHCLIANDGETVNCADFKIDERARYVRVSVRDLYGRWADTRGFFPDEIGL